MKKENYNLEAYVKPSVSLFSMPQNLSFLTESFSGQLDSDEIDLDPMEGNADDNL